MKVCEWYHNDTLLLTLIRKDNQYYLDSKPIPNKLGEKISYLAYENAIKEIEDYESKIS